MGGGRAFFEGNSFEHGVLFRSRPLLDEKFSKKKPLKDEDELAPDFGVKNELERIVCLEY